MLESTIEEHLESDWPFINGEFSSLQPTMSVYFSSIPRSLLDIMRRLIFSSSYLRINSRY